MRKCLSLVAVTALTLLGWAASASAALITFNTRAAFDLAAPGLPVEDFEDGSVPADSVVAAGDPLSSATNDAVFSTGEILAGLAISTPSIFPLALVANGAFGNQTQSIYVDFSSDTLDAAFANANAVGLDVRTISPDTITISVFGTGNALLGSFATATNVSGFFFGVINDAGPITRLSFSASSANEGIDNVAFGTAAVTAAPVPEPASLVLLGTGLAGAAVVRSRRRR